MRPRHATINGAIRSKPIAPDELSILSALTALSTKTDILPGSSRLRPYRLYGKRFDPACFDKLHGIVINSAGSILSDYSPCLCRMQSAEIITPAAVLRHARLSARLPNNPRFIQIELLNDPS